MMIKLHNTPENKRNHVNFNLKRMDSIFIHVDGRHPDAILPPHLKRQAQVNLQIGLNMPVPIPDLRIDETGIYGTLSFNRVPFNCFIPWDAMYILMGDDGTGFYFDNPPKQAFIEAGMIEGVVSINTAKKKLTTEEKKNNNIFKLNHETKTENNNKKPVERPSYLRVVK